MTTTKSLKVAREIERPEGTTADQWFWYCKGYHTALDAAQAPKVSEGDRELEDEIHKRAKAYCFSNDDVGLTSKEMPQYFAYKSGARAFSQPKPLSESELDAKFDELWKSETWDDDRVVFKAGYRLALTAYEAGRDQG
jgi:hypothetical protein